MTGFDDTPKPSRQINAEQIIDADSKDLDVLYTLTPPTEKVAVVKLVQTIHLPAHHSKLVHVTVDHNAALDTTLLFELDLTQLHKSGVTMCDALINKGKMATLVIQNRGVEPVILDKGHVVGHAESASTIRLPMDEDCQMGQETDVVDDVSVTRDPLEPSVKAVQGLLRMEQLCGSLNLGGASLHEEEQLELTELVKKYSELFALSSSELGRTSLVEHSINTGDHLPIKQLPRRVPYFLRAKVSQHVEEMLEQGVITPSLSP